MRHTPEGHLLDEQGRLRRDSLGRRIHINRTRKGGRSKGMAFYTEQFNIRMDKGMHARLMKIPPQQRASRIREWIEWGLENGNQ